jgi:hypothetical protein
MLFTDMYFSRKERLQLQFGTSYVLTKKVKCPKFVTVRPTLGLREPVHNLKRYSCWLTQNSLGEIYITHMPQQGVVKEATYAEDTLS